MTVKIEHIATAVIPSETTTFVNVYGVSDKGGVYIWDAKEGVWVPYIDTALAEKYKKSYKK